MSDNYLIINPMKHGVITSGFGPRNIGGKIQFHYGLDVADGSSDSEIYFPCKGKIIFMGKTISFGNRIWVELYNGSSYVIAHMSYLNKRLKVGQIINAGSLAGIVGNTGYSEGYHVHLEFREDYRYQDTAFIPLQLFKF